MACISDVLMSVCNSSALKLVCISDAFMSVCNSSAVKLVCISDVLMLKIAMLMCSNTEED